MHACDGRTDGQTDRRTDRILIAIPRLHCMQRGKNGTQKQKFPIWKIPIQNDRVYAPPGSQKREISAELLQTRSTFSKSVMLSVAVSLLRTTELMFIEPGVKINGANYVTSRSVSTFCRRFVP